MRAELERPDIWNDRKLAQELGRERARLEREVGTLERLEFDGIMTACVFAWEERARESSRFMREEIERRTRTWKHLSAPAGAAR